MSGEEEEEERGEGRGEWMGVTRCGLPATASPAGGEAVVHLMGHVLLGTGRALSREPPITCPEQYSSQPMKQCTLAVAQ